MARRIAYGALFAVVLPALLVAWARSVELSAPLPFRPATGWPLLLGGLALMAMGAWRLWTEAGGLPMNAFPPPRVATGGVFAFFPHPMYLGFSLSCFGVALLFRSPSGYWLVATTAMFAAAALAVGYEKRDLERRFGDAVPRFLPAAESAPPSLAERLRYVWFIEIPWVGLYYSAASFGVPSDAFDPSLSFEPLPIIPVSGLLYWSEYPIVVAAPFLARSRHDLRRFFVRSLAAIGIAFLLYFTIPSTAPRPPLPDAGWMTKVLAWERGQYPASVAFPSFHVMWALLIARLAQESRRAPWFWWTWAIAVSASCVFTGMHWVLDAVAGAIVAAILFRYERAWAWIRNAAERCANSWREWRFGPVRVMNQALPAALAATAGVWIAASYAGGESSVLIVATAALLASAAWAQAVEGSSPLLRPFGYYGALIGGSLAALLFEDSWRLLAAFATAASVVQGIGRVRCLMNGCCHGDHAPDSAGIRYSAPRTRVAALGPLRGVPVYPVQLYSIAANIAVFLILRRLWSVESSLQLICGVYLIASGISRFAEEGYRGEPQTPVIAGLRLYQWLAIASVVAGAWITTMGSTVAPAPLWSVAPLPRAALFGLLAGIAFGVDFPGSNRRFSRIAPA